MRGLSLSLRGVPVVGRVAYFAIVFLCLALAALGLRSGPLFLTFAALFVLMPFLVAAPFVFGAKWRTPPRRVTRRPVVRRRRH